MGDKNDDEEHEEGAYKDDPSLAKLTVTPSLLTPLNNCPY